ncbi:MAG: hypothetical protein KDB18_12865, partial [Salinibacterium sp.]|nr:hypothetical protein [Salinibacterium sp.]
MSERRTLRVIAVGPTGLEQTLRRDATVELIRARTPLDALGELADPIDESSPTDTVVVVSTAADASDSPSERAAFIAALREIDPRARIIRTGDGPMTGFDAKAEPNDDADTLRVITLATQPDEA